MASLLFNSFWNDLGKGNIDMESDTIKCMLVTSSYTENKDTHTKRSDITNEITATGYTAGGKTCTVAIATDTATDRTTYTIQSVNWPGYSGTSAKAVFYKSRGGAASADELIGVDDFSGSVTITGAIMVVADSVITVQN
jgi:hypothetical protein